MNPLYYLRDIQNTVSFAVRSRIRFKRKIRSLSFENEGTFGLQNELREFLYLFDWNPVIQHWKRSGGTTKNSIFRVADIGARDFSFAPVFDSHFRRLGVRCPEIHGIEVDAYRRYADLTTRADAGEYFAHQIGSGEYHAKDFLNWERSLDGAFLLHPFVTPEPPLRWGLPLSRFNPEKLFEHSYDLLSDNSGFLLLSNPSEREFEISCRMALSAGFVGGEEKIWHPREETFHKKPRFGKLFFSKNFPTTE